LLELQAGSVDGIDNVGPDDFDTVRSDTNLQLITRQALNIFYVGMNNTFPPFDNEMVRQAIAMGIDRQRLVDNFFPEGSEVATHFTLARSPWLRGRGVVANSRPVKANSCWLMRASQMVSRPRSLTAMWYAATCRSRVWWRRISRHNCWRT
jgi:ABC-type transport system substrate-binding protein